MKKDFSPVLKIKKENIKKIENDIKDFQIRQKKLAQEKEILFKELLSNNIPSHHSGGVLSVIKEIKTHLQDLIKEKEILLSKTNENLKYLQQEYKKALIEYEKIKYLQNIFVKKRKEEQERKERIELDEIAAILYTRAEK